MTEPTPKIRGYIASEKNKVLFLYRQSNKVTYLILYSYQSSKEQIEVGSRFYGRLYPNRCDISPDGAYFLYFAMGSYQQQYRQKLYCWTAVCKPPKIEAEILYAHGDTWGGGGRFIDDQTIFIVPGVSPDFDRTERHQFDRYQIVFEGERQNRGWSSSKGWYLAETQIDPNYGRKYPIPKYWTKTNGKIVLIRYLNYSSFLQSKDGKTQGAYDLHSYEVQSKSESQSLDNEQLCLWADFDNRGNLFVARGSNIFVYPTFKSVVESKPARTFDLEQLVSTRTR